MRFILPSKINFTNYNACTSVPKGFDISEILFGCNWLCIFHLDSGINEGCETSMEIFYDLLQNTSFYQKDERDMVLMNHIIDKRNTTTHAMKQYQSSLLVYGDQESSVRSTTVALAVTISVQHLLIWKFNENKHGLGFIGNTDVLEFVLKTASQLGIEFNQFDYVLSDNMLMAKIIISWQWSW